MYEPLWSNGTVSVTFFSLAVFAAALIGGAPPDYSFTLNLASPQALVAAMDGLTRPLTDHSLRCCL